MAQSFIPHICGHNRIYVPTEGCDDCAKFEARLSRVEAILEKKIEMSLYDRASGSITAEVLGEVVE